MLLLQYNRIFLNPFLRNNKEDHSIQKQQVTRINHIAVANISLKQIKDATTKIKILMGDFNDTYNTDIGETFHDLF